MSQPNRARGAPASRASGTPQATPRSSAAGAGEAATGNFSWRHCFIGLVAGELLLLVLSNISLGITNAAFGSGGLSQADGGIVGVASFVSVLFGGFLAARMAGRSGLYQGILVGIGFIAIGALYQFAVEAQIVHNSLASHTHTLVDLGPMSMGNLISGDFLALCGGSIGGLLARRR